MKCSECKKEIPPGQVGCYRLKENDCVCSACLATLRSLCRSGESKPGATKKEGK